MSSIRVVELNFMRSSQQRLTSQGGVGVPYQLGRVLCKFGVRMCPCTAGRSLREITLKEWDYGKD